MEKNNNFGRGKGDRHLLPERPFGCFAQKVPVPFSPFPLFPASLESAKMRSSALPTEMLCSAQKPAQFPRMLLLNASRHSQQLPPPGVNAGPKPEEKGDRHLLPEQPSTSLRLVPGFAQKSPAPFSTAPTGKPLVLVARAQGLLLNVRQNHCGLTQGAEKRMLGRQFNLPPQRNEQPASGRQVELPPQLRESLFTTSAYARRRRASRTDRSPKGQWSTAREPPGRRTRSARPCLRRNRN